MARARREDSLAHLLTKELMQEESEKMSWHQMAKKYNCGNSMILSLRKKYGMEAVKRKDTEDKQKLRPQKELYIAYEDLDLSFYPSEVEDVKELWRAGIHFTDIVAKMKKHYLEILALVTDLIDKGKLEPRKNGVIGEV